MGRFAAALSALRAHGADWDLAHRAMRDRGVAASLRERILG
jgi:hypothetical protein